MPGLPLWADEGEGRYHASLPVTDTLVGPLHLPLHVVTGSRPGPTLGITSVIHGDETLPAIMIRELLLAVSPAELAGRIAAIPLCNPLAAAAFGRQTPEQHGRTDLHEVFPGNPRGNVTQMLAHTIATRFIDHVDILIDYHCGGSGGRLQERVDVHAGAPQDAGERSLRLARCFGTRMVHKNSLGGTAVSYANGQGKPAFNAETAGVYLAPEATDRYVQQAVAGFKNVMRELGMLSGAVSETPDQVLYGLDGRKEVNPSRSGYLTSNFQKPDDLGKLLPADTVLGELIDLRTLEVVETLKTPTAGYLFFSRYSGAVDAGTKAFAIATDSASTKLA